MCHNCLFNVQNKLQKCLQNFLDSKILLQNVYKIFSGFHTDFYKYKKKHVQLFNSEVNIKDFFIYISKPPKKWTEIRQNNSIDFV